MALQDVIRWLVPRADHFYTFLEQQAETACEAVAALGGLRDGSRSTAEVRDAVQAVEHKGDELVFAMDDALGKTFVTPIDREDLKTLAQELDSVLDFTNAAARTCLWVGLQRPTTPMIGLIDVLAECTAILHETLPRLRRHDYAQIIEDARRLRMVERKGDDIFGAAIQALFADPSLDAKQLLREKAVLEELETAIDCCNSVGHTLANLAVKHA